MPFMGQKIPVYVPFGHLQDIKTMKTAWVMSLNPYFSYPTIKGNALVADQDQIVTSSYRFDLWRKAISLDPLFFHFLVDFVRGK